MPAQGASPSEGGEPWEGIAGLDAAVYAGFATTQAAMAEAKRHADCERAALRQALLQRGGALPAAAALAAASTVGAPPPQSPQAPGTPPAQWALEQELDTARRHASEAESARSRALHSQQLAAAAAADVQRESSAALSEVAQ